MSRRSNGRPGLRKYRQKMVTEGAVITGDRRLSEIVYCYRFPSHPGRVKIGYSSRGLARVAEQSTAFPEKPELIFVIHDKRARMIEEAFHVALKDHQADVMGTEWFDVEWEDILKVSPALRRATGRERVRCRRKIAAGVVLACVSSCLYPMLAMTQLGMAGNLSPDVIFSAWGAYFDGLSSGRIELVGQAWGDAVEAMRQSEMPVGMKVLPAMLAGVLPLLPWLIGGRKQAY